jgi:type II secretory pathway pseudopilin PulG
MKRRASAGYTILEVMIVMTVTAGLFIMIAVTFSGKQAQTELNQSARHFESQMQTVANDVANGYYPNGFTCLVSSGSISVNSGAEQPGANTGCIFLGKIMSFKKDNADIITVVGRQYLAGTTTDVSSLSTADPIVVANGSVNVTQIYPYRYGLEIQKIVSLADNTTTYQALGFMNELGGGLSGGLGATSSGSRGVKLFGITGNANTNITPDMSVNPSTLVAIPQGVKLCFLGGNGKKVEITIGASGSQTNTNVLVDNGVGSDCD